LQRSFAGAADREVDHRLRAEKAFVKIMSLALEDDDIAKRFFASGVVNPLNFA